MNYPKYGIASNHDFTIFKFISIGKNGVITKVIEFTKTNNGSVYNLGFGDRFDINTEKGFSIDDVAISNNGDRNKILATIANAIFVFTENYPERYVYFTGTTLVRTRLYRMVISNNIKELSSVFYIFGIVHDKLTGRDSAIDFDSDKNFIGFLIKRR